MEQVARDRDISTSLIYTWRRQLREEAAEAGFAPAVVDDGAARETPERCEAIVVELPDGRVRIGASAPPALASAVIKALR